MMVMTIVMMRRKTTATAKPMCFMPLLFSFVPLMHDRPPYPSIIPMISMMMMVVVKVLMRLRRMTMKQSETYRRPLSCVFFSPFNAHAYTWLTASKPVVPPSVRPLWSTDLSCFRTQLIRNKAWNQLLNVCTMFHLTLPMVEIQRCLPCMGMQKLPPSLNSNSLHTGATCRITLFFCYLLVFGPS